MGGMSSSVFVPSETCREHDEAADNRGEVEHDKCGHGILHLSADYSWHRSRELIWVKSALDRAGYCRNYRLPDGRYGVVRVISEALADFSSYPASKATAKADIMTDGAMGPIFWTPGKSRHRLRLRNPLMTFSAICDQVRGALHVGSGPFVNSRRSQLAGLAAFHAKLREGAAHPGHEGVELGHAQWARISRTPLGAIRVECQSRERRDPKRRTAYE
jgi:hypothetical protein